MDNGQKPKTTEQMLDERKKALLALCGKGSEVSKHTYEPETHDGVNRYAARKKATAKAEVKVARLKAKLDCKVNW